MQPEPNETFQNISLPQSSQENTRDSQHGFHDSDVHPSPQLPAGEGRAKPRRSASNTSPSASSAGSSDDARERPLRRLSPPSRQKSGSPVDRIIEHEKDLTYLPKKRAEERTFTIVQRGKNLGSAQVAIGDFPNEVLTHILSHLPPSSLSDVSLVSRRFHQLVTTPHAWRIAFSRFFPGAEALSALDTNSELSEDSEIRSERRFFTRLTALASWRSEYILRTRLLRSIGRGKPTESLTPAGSGSSRPGTGSNGSAHVTYNSDLVTLVDHLHATFGTGFNKRLPRFIHGATEVGMASSSDPRTSKVDAWGFSDSLITQQFEDVHPGEAPYGLGAGEVIGLPNTMDISQPYGMIYAEGMPGGRVYYRSMEEKRGRDLASPLDNSIPELGIPATLPTESMCSVWISKTPNVPDLSEGIVGMLVGSSSGLVSAYSLGTNPLRERRLERGELTARWVLSPGVPIIAIAVDENFSSKRRLLNHIWAFALNALGEVFFLSDFPVRPNLDRALKLDKARIERLAWQTGRTVHWTLVEATRRIARPDPFDRSEVDGSYSPRTSWDGTCLSKEQLAAEIKEIDVFLRKKPKNFRKVCEGWDMRRRLEVDFAASDENGAGEVILVIGCGLDEGQQAMIKRYTRCKVTESSDEDLAGQGPSMPIAQGDASHGSIFGDHNLLINGQPTWSFEDRALSRRSSTSPSDSELRTRLIEEWRTSVFLLGGLKSPQITTTAIDLSNFALLTTTEDPLLSVSGSLAGSSPPSSPMGRILSHSLTDVPGQRARLFAIGTKTGTIVLWNARAPVASNTILENNIKPIRIIYTDSPQISCLALSSLYLVHGGNDGLVQAWDPLASTTDPIRTLNSRFSSRARRRLVQAEASPAGVGINLFAAGAICLDPDPTILRGMVSLGSHLRYWSYSSQAADQYKGNKRRLRRSERGSNQGGDRFYGTGRGALKDYIANEKLELEREKREKREEEKRLAGRFGVDLLGPGASEDEILAYATMLSEEAAQSHELRKKSASDGESSSTITEEAVASPVSSAAQDDIDDDMAEAIRLSLQENSNTSPCAIGIPAKYAKVKRNKASPSGSPPRSGAFGASPKASEASNIPAAELDDLEFALRLSQAEEESRAQSGKGKGKGKGRAF